MNVQDTKGLTLGKLAEAYGISRSALDRMRINYVIYPEELFSPAIVFYKLLKGRSTELRTRLASIEERKRIREIINFHIK